MVVPKKYEKKIEPLTKTKKILAFIGFLLASYGLMPISGIPYLSDLYEMNFFNYVAATLGTLLFLYGTFRKRDIDEGNVIHLKTKK